jgi:transposase
MRQKSNSNALSSEEIVKGIRRATRKRYSAEEKIRIVLDGLRRVRLLRTMKRGEAYRPPPWENPLGQGHRLQ